MVGIILLLEQILHKHKSDRFRVYINGEQSNLTSYTISKQNEELQVNRDTTHYIILRG